MMPKMGRKLVQAVILSSLQPSKAHFRVPMDWLSGLKLAADSESEAPGPNDSEAQSNAN